MSRSGIHKGGSVEIKGNASREVGGADDLADYQGRKGKLVGTNWTYNCGTVELGDGNVLHVSLSELVPIPPA